MQTSLSEPEATSRTTGPSRFPFTDMPWPLMIGLVAVGLPRTVLADLDVVAPESSPVYYVLALAPFVVWTAVAVLRPTRRPVRDFVVLGVLYALSLILAHQLLWHADGAEHSIPQGAVDFADRFDGPWRELATRGYTAVVSIVIGVGLGVIEAAIAWVAHVVRGRRCRDAAQESGA